MCIDVLEFLTVESIFSFKSVNLYTCTSYILVYFDVYKFLSHTIQLPERCLLYMEVGHMCYSSLAEACFFSSTWAGQLGDLVSCWW